LLVWLLQATPTATETGAANSITGWEVANFGVQVAVAAGTLWLAWLAYSQIRTEKTRRQGERYRSLVLAVHYPLRDAIATDDEDPEPVRRYLPWETVERWRRIRANRPEYELALIGVPFHNALRQLDERAEKSAEGATRVNPRKLFEEALQIEARELADRANRLDFVVRKGPSWVTQKYDPEEIWGADVDLLKIEAEKRAEYADDDVGLALFDPGTDNHLLDVPRDTVARIWQTFVRLLNENPNFKTYKTKKREGIAAYRRVKTELEKDLARLDRHLHA
jgi:hypothetical protein